MKRESDKQQKKKNTPILKAKAVVKEVTTTSTVVISRDIKKRVVKVVRKIKVAKENIEREMIGSQILVREEMKQSTINLNLHLHIHLRSYPISQRLFLSKLKTRTLRSA